MLNRLLGLTGYVLVRAKAYRHLQQLDQTAHYALHRYEGEDGEFDYDAYKRIQNDGNSRKIENVFVREENIAFLANYIRQRVGAVSFGLCHGTRRGAEQAWFRQYLNAGAEVIGTEIADTATDFPHTVQWDFHEVKDEWVAAADFIYSNSFDHSFDPEKALAAWMRCLKPGGVCLLEHTKAHRPEKASQLDPFGARLEAMPYLVATWGRGAFAVTEILNAPVRYSKGTATSVLVVEHRRPPAAATAATGA